VQDRIAAGHCAFDSARVGYVAERDLDRVDADRAERWLDALRSSRKDANSMSGGDQGSDRVRPDVTSPACDQDEHAESVLIGVSRVQWFV
jgi:hypothetical protein